MKKILLVGSGNVATHLAQNIDNKNTLSIKYLAVVNLTQKI